MSDETTTTQNTGAENASTATPGTGAATSTAPQGAAAYMDAGSGNFDIRRLTNDRLAEQDGTKPAPTTTTTAAPAAGTATATDPTITIGEYKVPQKKMQEMLAAFGGDMDALDRALKNPDHIFRLVSKNWSPRVAKAVEIEKENAALRQQLQQRPQYAPPPPAPVPAPAPAPAAVPDIPKMDENDQVFGDQNKVLNALLAKNSALSQQLEGLKGNVETAVTKNPATAMLITQQFDNLRKTHGDDVYLRAAQRIAQDVGFKVLEDGRIDMTGIAPDKMIAAIDHMNFYANTYKTVRDADETAIQAGLKNVPWIEGFTIIEKSIRNNVMDECFRIKQELGHYPDAEHMTKLVGDAAIELEKEMDAAAVKRSQLRSQVVKPLGTGPTTVTPTNVNEKPLSAKDFMKEDGTFDAAAFNAEYLRRTGS